MSQSPGWDSPPTRSHAPGAPASATRAPGRTRVDLFVLAMQPALVHSPDLHANPITEPDIRQKLAYRPLRPIHRGRRSRANPARARTLTPGRKPRNLCDQRLPERAPGRRTTLPTRAAGSWPLNERQFVWQCPAFAPQRRGHRAGTVDTSWQGRGINGPTALPVTQWMYVRSVRLHSSVCGRAVAGLGDQPGGAGHVRRALGPHRPAHPGPALHPGHGPPGPGRSARAKRRGPRR